MVFAAKGGVDPITLAEHLQQCAQDITESPIIDVRIKLGVYEIDETGLPVSALVEHAELAVDSIHDDIERSAAWFEPPLLERKLWDQKVLSDFERALGDEEFQIYLQPQVNAEGRILGAEALARWLHAGEVLRPESFSPVLSHSELLCHLDETVWEQAAALLGSWQGTDLERYTISINVDPSDFLYIDVPQRLGDLCERYGVPRDSLRVEITETALVEDTEHQSHIVDRLHEQGFLVEIDDFGKGTSSLSMLKDIHADILKIDMGFLQDKRNTDRSRIILASVIEMAQQLNMDVITEGVERKEQLRALTSLGCELFQGFFFSRPIPVRDFVFLARAQSAHTPQG